jgi:ubiquinone/menaquinone biosynthesis C-methylase UbiE
MDARLQQRVQRYGWDRAASYYEQSWSRQLAPAQDLLMKMAALKPGERVLDIACGTGLVTFRAASAVGPTGEVVGTDISEAMVDAGRAAASARGVTNARFERMEAEELSLPDAFFDAVLCALGMMYVTDFAGSIREMFRVTKRDGRAASAVWGKRDRCGWAEIFSIVEKRVQSDVCPMFFQLGTGEMQAALFASAGFADIQTERITTMLEYANGEEACVAAFAGGPVTMAYSRFDDDARASAHADYLQSIAAFKRGTGYAVPGEFVVTRGEKP